VSASLNNVRRYAQAAHQMVADNPGLTLWTVAGTEIEHVKPVGELYECIATCPGCAFETNAYGGEN
jgi:hypothetical protein